MNAAPQTSAAQLDVFFGDELVGTVHDTAPLSFSERSRSMQRILSSGAQSLPY